MTIFSLLNYHEELMLSNKTATLRLGVLSVFAFALSFGLHAQTDVNKVVKAESSGSSLYIHIDHAALDLFNDSTIARLNPDGDSEWNTWKDALTNGNSPGMNVDFDSYAAFGLTDVDGSGDLTLGTITMTGFIIDGVGNATTNSLNNSNGGITNTGSIAGATSIDGSGDLTMGTVTMIGFSVDAAGAVDINSGTIDGATIATSDVTVGAGKTLDVSAGTLTLADDQISGDKVEGGTIASITISQLSGAMDANNQTMTNVDVNSGTIDGATIATSDVTVGAGKTLDVSAGTLTLADDQISGDKVEGGTIASITISQLSGAMDANNQTMTNVDVNSGTIDGATIATSDVTVGAGKTLDVSAGTLTLADDQISGDKVEGGTIASITISQLSGAMDANNQTMTNVDVNSGTIDGATIATSDVTVGAAKTLDVSAGTLTLAAGQVDADRVGAGTFDAGSYSFNGSTISDLGTVTTADINGGTIDGATIATSDVTVGAGKTLDVSAGTLTLAAGQVDADRVGAGTFDAGSYSFNGSTISDLGTVTTADINGGTIDGATIATSDVTVGAGKTLDVSAGTLTLSAGQVDADRVGAGTFDAGSYSFNGSTISDLGTVTTADINGGTIDGADVTVGAGTTLDVSAGTLTLADDQISGDKVEGGTIAAISISQVSGANLITRASTADAEDLTVSQTGGTNSSVSIESSGTGADAVSLNASAGGISLTAAAASNITTSAGALTLDGAGGVDIDGSTISVDGTDNSNLTMTANDAGTKTLTIAASNSGAGVGAISVDADGALTLGGSSVDVDADGGTLSLDGSTGLNIGTAADVAIDMDASTLDIDASGAVTLDGGSSVAINAASLSSNTTGNTSITVNDGSTAEFTNSGSDAGLQVIASATASSEKVYLVNSNGSSNDALIVKALTGGLELESGTQTDVIAGSHLQLRANGGFATLNGSSGINLVGNAAEIDVTTSGAVDINSGAFTVDGSTISVDGTDNSNLTMTANDAGTKTLTIAASNSGAGTGAISVDADGTLTMDSDGALTMGGSSVDVDADGGTLSLDGSTGLNIGTNADQPIDMDASTLDIDASGAVTIDATGANAISIGADANTGAINVGTGASARAIQVGNAASTSVGIDALAVTIESVNALNLTDGTADLAYDGSGNVALTSVAYDHTATGAISIDVVDNTSSAYSIGSTGKADILKVVSTDAGEGVTMSGTLGVLGLSSLRGIDNAHNGITNAGALSEVSSIASATASPTALDIDASGILQLDGAGGITIGVAADKAIDMDASTLDIDASGAVTIDGASTIQINAVTSTTFTGDVKGPKSTGDDEFVTYWQLDSLANTAAFNETYKATNTGVDQTLTNGTLTRVKITGAPGYGTENSDPAINFAPNPAPITLLTSGGPGSEGGFAHHFNLSDKGVYQVMLTMELDNTGNEDAFVKVELMNNNPSPAVGETNPRVLASDTEVVYEDWSGVGAGADLRSHVNMSMMFVTLEDDEDVYANIIAYNGGGGGTAAVVIRTLSFSVSRVGEK